MDVILTKQIFEEFLQSEYRIGALEALELSENYGQFDQASVSLFLALEIFIRGSGNINEAINTSNIFALSKVEVKQGEILKGE